MTTKKDWNPQKHKKIFFVAITIFAVLIITSIIVIILQQKEETEEFEYCNMSFRTKEQSELCKKKVKETWHPQYINCMPWSADPLCGKAEKAWYPYIAR